MQHLSASRSTAPLLPQVLHKLRMQHLAPACATYAASLSISLDRAIAATGTAYANAYATAACAAYAQLTHTRPQVLHTLTHTRPLRIRCVCVAAHSSSLESALFVCLVCSISLLHALRMQHFAPACATYAASRSCMRYVCSISQRSRALCWCASFSWTLTKRLN
jgi:hypothetical protein